MGRRVRARRSSRSPSARRPRQTAPYTSWCRHQEDKSVQLYKTILLVGLALVVARGAVAQAAYGPGEVTVDDLVARALADNPGLQATQAEVDAAHGRLQQAGLRPNPMLDLGVQQNVAGPDNNLTASV